MKRLLILGISIFLHGCAEKDNIVSCANVVNQFNKHTYHEIYAEKGFERIAHQIEREKYENDFNEKLSYHIYDLKQGKKVVLNPFINDYCYQLHNLVSTVEKNETTELSQKLNDVQNNWLGHYHTVIKDYEFKPIVYIKDGRCQGLAKKLNDFYLNKELERKRGKEQFEMAKKAYQQCINIVEQ